MTLREWLTYMLNTSPHIVCDAQVTIFARHGFYPGPPSERDADDAIRHLPQFSIIGNVENFNDACIAGEYYLAPTFGPLDFSYVRENVSSYRSGGQGRRAERYDELLGEKLHAQLRAGNQLDTLLWTAARRELERRLQLIPDLERRRDSFAQRLREMEVAVEISRREEAEAIANGTIASYTYPRLRPAWQRMRAAAPVL
jgi:hypothetical protein